MKLLKGILSPEWALMKTGVVEKRKKFLTHITEIDSRIYSWEYNWYFMKSTFGSFHEILVSEFETRRIYSRISVCEMS